MKTHKALDKKRAKEARKTEEAYTIISEAFGKEHKTEMLHYNAARSKLEADAEHYKDFLKQIEEENTGN